MGKISPGKQIIIIVLFAALLSLMPFQGYAEKNRGVTGNLVKVGLLTDLTGPAAPTTVHLAAGVRNYFRDINDMGGISGRKIKLLVEDDRYSIPLAVAGFKKLVCRDKIFALLGIAQGGAPAALSKSIEKERVPYIASPLNASLINPLKRHVFIPTPLYSDSLNAGIDYLEKKQGRL